MGGVSLQMLTAVEVYIVNSIKSTFVYYSSYFSRFSYITVCVSILLLHFFVRSIYLKLIAKFCDYTLAKINISYK